MNKGYDFYIDDLLLPITPKKINTKIKNKNKMKLEKKRNLKG